MDPEPKFEGAMLGHRFLPPGHVQSLRDLAGWMLQSSLDTQSEEAVTVIPKDGRSFESYFLERCCDEYLLITRYLDDGDLTTPEEKAHKGFVALDWSAIGGLRWTTARLQVEPHG